MVPGKSRLGGLAVGVPGTVAGIFAVHERFGTMPMEQILQPVIDLARNGFVVSENQQETFEEYRDLFLEVNNDTILFARNYLAGDTLKNFALANTLERLVENGRKEFYSGITARKLIANLEEQGGIITLEDLADYKVAWREPITFEYDDYNTISMSPPSSGGIVLAQIMNSIESFPLKEYGHNSGKYIQVLTEAEKRAYADRSFFLGDPDFVAIPVDTLISEHYLKNRMQNFSFKKATPSSEIEHGGFSDYESNETTHYSIVDQFGNAVAVTTTLNGAYGSKV